jgi:hypothetical protein
MAIGSGINDGGLPAWKFSGSSAAIDLQCDSFIKLEDVNVLN